MRLRWTLRLGRIAGIIVSVHPSWIIIYALFAYAATNIARLFVPELSAISSVALGLVASLVLFASVVAHEFAHALVARRLGIPIAGITLFLFGGVASIVREPKSPFDEVRMAAAGPALSIGLACVFTLLALAARELHWVWIATLCGFLGMANAMLAIFNLLPAFPSDGGRILRALLWAFKKSQARATSLASIVSLVIAVALAGAGLYFTVSWHAGLGVWWIVLGTFLAQAAIISGQQARVDLILEELTVADSMRQKLVPVPASTSVAAFIGEVAGVAGAAYPVVEEGRPIGVIDVRHTAGMPLAVWDSTPVTTVMTPLAADSSVAASLSARQALSVLHDRGVSELPVFEGAALVGIVSQESIFQALHARRAALKARA